jgi:hypothetical protein
MKLMHSRAASLPLPKCGERGQAEYAALLWNNLSETGTDGCG